jgi:signal transduction histidine kinase
MKSKYLPTIISFCLLIAAAFLVLLYCTNQQYAADSMKQNLGNEMVSLNKVVQLSEQVKENPKDAALSQQLQEAISSVHISQAVSDLSGQNLLSKTNTLILLSMLLCILFAFGFYTYLYFKIIKPFQKLEKFAGNVAAGDFDFPLEIDRNNTFGAFSWAFDFMRTELKNAKESEQEALQAKKTLVATISHDIKTPVSSIRAYAEALTSNMATTPERKGKYLKVIMNKADEVARLTDDLFLHAISDMEKLSIEIGTYQAPALAEEILEPFFAQYGDKIQLNTEIPNVSVSTDKRRISQVFENIITNASKYAEDSQIDLAFHVEDGFLICNMEDFGGGIPAEDLPFIFDKFYRGKNSKDKKGSGLGLYIVKYIMDKTGGSVKLQNTEKGLQVNLGIKILGI